MPNGLRGGSGEGPCELRRRQLPVMVARHGRLSAADGQRQPVLQQPAARANLLARAAGTVWVSCRPGVPRT